nr:MAG TPA: tail collar fiber protein [Caudoviricetes sp.]
MHSKFFTMTGGGAGGGIKLDGISITTPPDKTAYLPGEVFDPAGMVVTALYSNGATLTATGWTYSPSGALPEGTSEVEIIYTEAGVTKTAVQAITVERGTISVPTVSGSLTYNGKAQSPTLTGYDADKMVLSGDTSGTNAGSYTAVVTPTEQYKWADGSTEAKNIQWSIDKSTPSITFDPASVSLDTSTTSQAVAVTYTGDGTLSAQSDNSGVATASLEGTTLTVTGVETGNTAIQVSASEGTNYTAASASLSVAVQFAIIIPVVPTQSGSLTYKPYTLQTVAWKNYDPDQLTIGGSVKGTNAGTYTATFTPKPGYQWWDGTTETKNATWTIGRAPLVVSFSPRSGPGSPLVLGANNKTAVVSVQTNAESTTFFIESQQSKEYISTNVDVDSGTITISALKSTNGLAANSTVFYVHISAGSNYTSSTPGYYVRVESLTSVFGVSWDSSQPSTALTRLTKANDPNKLVTVDITTEPVPAVGTGSGSSPFDNYMPWMGMEEYNVVEATGLVGPKKGESGFSRRNSAVMVKIPEFYYKVEKSGNIFHYYVADSPVDGFNLHPGSECYVARYEGIAATNSSLGKFLRSYSSNLTPGTGETRADFRTRARNMASGFQLYDFAAWCAVGLLYLVEFADWDSQEKINRGIVNDSSVHKTGETDAMVYHTGRAAGGLINTAAVQYRWIENPWGNVFEWIDGINVNNRVPYICTEPESYADDTTSNYTSSGITLPNSGWIKGLGFSSVFPWALLPDTTGGGSATTYIPDYINSSAGWSVVDVSSCYTNASIAGLFFFDASQRSGISSQYIGARLQFREVKA